MSTNNPTAALTIELERAALRAVARYYEELNHSLFSGRLKRPTLRLDDGASRLGCWLGEERTLELSRTLMVDHGWGVLTEVLKHEMAHQYVDEVLGERAEGSHGRAFRGVCRERGIDARAVGVPADGGNRHAAGAALERVSKLLALAGSSNAHEAQNAMNLAQRLMLKHNLDAVLEGRGATYSFRHLGEPTGRVEEHARILALILDEHFFVQCIWVPVWRPLQGKRGSVLEVCGTLENLELAAYVHSFLTHTAERQWKEYQKQRGTRENRNRRTFLAGVMAGFRQKLKDQTQKSQAEGLVWLGDPELRTFFRRRHPQVRWARYGSSYGSQVFAHGHAAGRSIVLNRGISAGASGSRPRLLPARR